MAFKPVRLSQRDPQWKNDLLGFSSYNLATSGCAVSSVAMLLSGYGYNETPGSLNAKLKQKGGFMDAAIVWGAVRNIYPAVQFKNIILCRDSDAPLAQINASIAAGKPVLVEVDSSPSAGLQTHWVVLYARQDNDYLMLDPWPYPVESGDTLMMKRYSHGKPLARAITAAVWYEVSGSAPVSVPPAQTPSTTGASMTVRVVAGLDLGLRLRAAASTESDTLAQELSGTLLAVLEPLDVAQPKIGVFNQWLRVRDPQGLEGYVAAWYVETAGAPISTPSTPANVPVTPTVPEPPPPAPPQTPSEPATVPPAETPPVVIPPTTPPAQVETPPATTTTPPPVTTKPPAPPAAPAEPPLTVYVLRDVGTSGLRMRAQPSTGGTLVKIIKAGHALTTVEPAKTAKPKVGQQNIWLNVIDATGATGYVAAWMVTLDPSGGAPAAPAAPATPTKPPATTTTKPPQAPAPSQSGTELVVTVSASVGSSGLRLRKIGSAAGALVAIEKVGTRLVVLDPPAVAKASIGQPNKWLNVRDPQGKVGYVAAAFVELPKQAVMPTVSFSMDDFSAAEPVRVHVSGLAAKGGGLNLRSAPAENAPIIKRLPAYLPLELLDAGDEENVGKFNTWLHVRDPYNAEGYVVAWYVELTE